MQTKLLLLTLCLSFSIGQLSAQTDTKDLEAVEIVVVAGLGLSLY